jgi:hypothetical protein
LLCRHLKCASRQLWYFADTFIYAEPGDIHAGKYPRRGNICILRRSVVTRRSQWPGLLDHFHSIITILGLVKPGFL